LGKEHPFLNDPDKLYRQLQVILTDRYSEKIIEASTTITKDILHKLPIKEAAREAVIESFGSLISARIEVLYMPRGLQPKAVMEYERAEHHLTNALSDGLEFEGEQTVPILIERIKKAVDTKLEVIRERK